MIIRLLQNHRFWLEGQEIGVEDEAGQGLIDAGIAEDAAKEPSVANTETAAITGAETADVKPPKPRRGAKPQAEPPAPPAGGEASGD